MKFLTLSAALALAAVAAAQTGNAPQPFTGTLQDGGIYDIATGTMLPPNSPPSAQSATTGRIYFNKCPANTTSGNTYYYYGSPADEVILDDGRVPSRTSPAPAVGVLDKYEITQFRFGYVSGELAVANGGPGTTVTVYFWDDYDSCTSFATAGTPTKQFTLQGLGGTTSTTNPPAIAGWLWGVNVPAGSWYMNADADGTYNGVANQDTFGYAAQFTAAGTPGATYGLFVGGSYNATVGDGTYYQNPGASIGTGLGNSQQFMFDDVPIGGTANCYVGSATTVGLWGGKWLEMTANIDDCNGNGQPDSLDITNGAPDCDGNGVPDACDIAAGAPDCNNNGVLDTCDLLAGTSVDTNSNGVPDECECGFLINYCTPGTTSSGCLATISGAGTPSASAGSGFFINCANLQPQQSGIIFYGVNGAVALPWGPSAAATSFMCVKSPVDRTVGVQNTGGSGTCSGTMTLDWNQYIATTPGAQGTPFLGGEIVWAQGWFRDPPATKTTSLTDGLQFKVCP